MNSNLTSLGVSYEVKTFLIEEGKSLPFTPPVPLILFNTSPHAFSIFGGENESKKVKRRDNNSLPGISMLFFIRKKR